MLLEEGNSIVALISDGGNIFILVIAFLLKTVQK